MLAEADIECCKAAKLGGTHKERCGDEVVVGGGAGISGLDRPMCEATWDDDGVDDDNGEKICFGDDDNDGTEDPGLEKDLIGAPASCDDGDRDF